MGFMDSLKKLASGIQLRYLGGHPEAPTACDVTVCRDGDYLSFTGMHRPPDIFVPTVKHVELIPASKLGTSTSRAAVGALIGGALAGGIGALAGAGLNGIRQQDSSIIAVTVDYKGMDVQLLFSGKDVTATYGQFMAMLAAPVTHPTPADDTGRYDVIITAIPPKQKVKVIMALQTTLRLNLMEADALLRNLPAPVKTLVSRGEADAIKEKLASSGATVEIVPNK